MREEILHWLQVRWAEKPEWSMAQLLSQYCYIALGHTELSELSDEALLKVLKEVGGFCNEESP